MEEEQRTTSTAGQGFGITALVLGIIALLTAPIPCIGILALIPGILGIIFAIVALVQASQGHGAKGLIITALVISILGTSISTVWVLVISSPPVMRHSGFRGLTKQLKTLQRELEGLEDEIDHMDLDSADYNITIQKTIRVTQGDKEKLLEELEGEDSTGGALQNEPSDSAAKTTIK
jgi:hypothetical protein